MTSDSSPQSPSILETSSNSLSPTAATKKARRQTAFYPNIANKPQKPFSRSAAKRESVMALGSIEHLQHYFTKTGIAAKQNPGKPNSNLVPAIGRGLVQTNLLLPAHQPNFVLPPSPMVPPPLRPAFPPFVKTYQVDPELLKPGVIEDLEAVERVWGLGRHHIQSQPDPDLLGGDKSRTIDVLSILRTTTHTIRSVRNYLVSLPDDFATPAAEFRPHSRLSPNPTPRKTSHLDAHNDTLVLIRKSALDVLTVLRNIEESARIPLSDDVYEVQSDAGSSTTRSHTPGGTEHVVSDDDEESTASFSFSVVQVPMLPQKNSVLVWSDEEDEEEKDADEKKERWDERLVLGGGWLYKQDLTLESLATERDVVGKYLDVVDKVLFNGHNDEIKRGWDKERERLAKGRRASSGEGELPGQSMNRGRRVVSAGMLDAMRSIVVTEEPEDMLHSVVEEDDDDDEGREEVEDDDLPDWAKRNKFEDDPSSRLLSLLVTLLPADLLPLLPSPANTDRSTLLLRLSSGQILCTAYNIAVRKSRKPWGYISKAAIHDIAALEAASAAGEDFEKKQTGWTFRRTDNLRLWAAALKLRYMIPLGLTKSPPPQQGNNTPVTSPISTQSSFSLPGEPMIPFDPQLIAKREEGWDTMLENGVLRWMWCVVGERREAR